jgi:hypothetical protein
MVTDYAREVDAFKDSDEWLVSANPRTLGAPPTQQQYLENRLLQAFQAGWNARAKYADEPRG